VFDGGEVGGGIFLSDAVFIVSEDHVQDPMGAVLNAPVIADCRGDDLCVGGERRDKEASFRGCFIGGFALGGNGDNASEAFPGVAFREPFDVLGDNVVAGFQTTVVGIGGLMPGDFEVGEVTLRLFTKQ